MLDPKQTEASDAGAQALLKGRETPTLKNAAEVESKPNCAWVFACVVPDPEER